MDAAQEPRNPPEFAKRRRLRLALILVACAPVALMALLITASIVVDLFANRRLSRARALGAADLAACNGAVTGLLDRLVGETARLEQVPLAAGGRDLGAEWDAFAGRWQTEWEETGARCGFGEREGTGLGAAYDRMAWVHRNLPTTRLKLRELVAHFARDVGVDVAEMRDALDKSRAGLPQAPGQGKAQ